MSQKKDLIRILVRIPAAVRITQALIEKSQIPPEEGETQPPYEYAGQRAGMPAQEVYAMTRDGRSIKPFIPQIIREVQQTVQQFTETKR